ncbi:MAG: DegT/DnrJ/EryC1/StrS family aminotransferase, partial [Acidovorax sp.]|nr:DegT/DnrJ/EryC1/StrS family aminotransferase [Acidovorax sp.]
IVQNNMSNHAAYCRALAGVPGIRVLSYDSTERNSHHYIVLEVGPECPVSRDAIIEALHAENVLARKYFWPGSHRMQPYRDLFPHAGLVLPHTCTVAEQIVVLPNGMSMRSEHIDVIASLITLLVRSANATK